MLEIFDLFTTFSNIIIMIVSFVVCYIIAKNNNMSGYFTLLGFFGITGIIAMVIISHFGNNGNNNSYNGNGRQSNNNSNNSYTEQHTYFDQNDYYQNDSTYEEQPKEKYKYCPKCGAKIEYMASFCSYCGKEFHQ